MNLLLNKHLISILLPNMMKYILIFAVPRRSPAQFISAIHDSELLPLSVSTVTGWLHQSNQSQVLPFWTNLVVLPNENVKFPEDDAFGTQNSWTITLSQAAEPNSTRLTKRPSSLAGSQEVPRQPQQLGRGQAIFQRPEHWPESLLQFTNHKLIFEGPVITVCLVQLPDEGSRSHYEEFFKDVLQSVDLNPTIEIQASGTIEASTGNAAGSFDEALLLRCTSMEEFAAVLKSGWWNELVATHNLQSVMSCSAQLVVQELGMPDKGIGLDIYGGTWKYGNLYERPGQDFFG